MPIETLPARIDPADAAHEAAPPAGRGRGAAKKRKAEEKGETGAARLSGVVFPSTGPLAKDAGRRVQAMGSVVEWEVVYAKGGPTVVVRTDSAEYTCVKAEGKYRQVRGWIGHPLASVEGMCRQVRVSCGGRDCNRSVATGS